MGVENVIALEGEVKWNWQQGVMGSIKEATLQVWVGMKAEAEDQKEIALITLSGQTGQVSHVYVRRSSHLASCRMQPRERIIL